MADIFDLKYNRVYGGRLFQTKFAKLSCAWGQKHHGNEVKYRLRTKDLLSPCGGNYLGEERTPIQLQICYMGGNR